MPSPIPEKIIQSKTLTFPQAIEEITRGKKVYRLEWASGRSEYGFLAPDGYLSIHRQDKDHQWLVSDGDMLATDWVVIEEN